MPQIQHERCPQWSRGSEPLKLNSRGMANILWTGFSPSSCGVGCREPSHFPLLPEVQQSSRCREVGNIVSHIEEVIPSKSQASPIIAEVWGEAFSIAFQGVLQMKRVMGLIVGETTSLSSVSSSLNGDNNSTEHGSIGATKRDRAWKQGAHLIARSP